MEKKKALFHLPEQKHKRLISSNTSKNEGKGVLLKSILTMWIGTYLESNLAVLIKILNVHTDF